MKNVKQINQISDNQRVVFLPNKSFLYNSIIVDSTIICQHPRKEIRQQPPSSPHAAGEYCSDCGRWFRWLKKKEYDAVLNSANTHLIGGVA